jgi:hypothetical protein
VVAPLRVDHHSIQGLVEDQAAATSSIPIITGDHTQDHSPLDGPRADQDQQQQQTRVADGQSQVQSQVQRRKSQSPAQLQKSQVQQREQQQQQSTARHQPPQSSSFAATEVLDGGEA